MSSSSGPRRAEASALLVGDDDERRRASDPRLHRAIKGSTSWWATIRYGKRGRTRAIPIDEGTLAAIIVAPRMSYGTRSARTSPTAALTPW